MQAALDAGRTVIFLPAVLSSSRGADEFRRLVDALLKQGLKELVVDMSACTYCDSTGLAALVRAFSSCRTRSGSLSLNRVHGRVRDLLSLTTLLTVFPVLNEDLSGLSVREVSPEDLSPLFA